MSLKVFIPRSVIIDLHGKAVHKSDKLKFRSKSCEIDHFFQKKQKIFFFVLVAKISSWIRIPA